MMLLSAVCGASLVSAQDAKTDLTQQANFNDRTRESMFNQQNPSGVLSAGGAFYVSNPPPAYEVDPQKAYLDPEFTELKVVLVDGSVHKVPGRIRIIDQQVEIKIDGEVFELDRQVVSRFSDQHGRTFVAAFDPTRRIDGIHLYRVAHADETYRLLVNEAGKWEDPPQQNMFDTSEPRRTLSSVTRYYLVGPDGAEEIDNFRELCRALGQDKSGRVKDLQREKKGEGDEALYVALLETL